MTSRPRKDFSYDATEFHGRLNACIKAHKINASKLAFLSGVAPGAISRIRHGQFKPSFVVLTALIGGLPRANIQWLLFGGCLE